jgi:DNA-directed RNA polymerase specialized sigma24 family protein
MEYADHADFRKIFERDMNSLYLLSFLLTADEKSAEQCFVSGLADCIEGNAVFKNWARSWARHTIVQNAIRKIAPKPKGAIEQRPAAEIRRQASYVPEQYHQLASVIQLEPFERFVFVMSVLERYSDQECSVLLGCSALDVAAARRSALQQIGDYSASEPYGQNVLASDERTDSLSFKTTA